MFTLEKTFSFEASHQLPHHDGKCARIHGHSWKAALILAGDELHGHGPKTGMLMDYGDISAAIKPLLEEKLDHHHLNDSLGGLYPTSENLAKWIFDQIKPLLPLLYGVRIEETCTAACTYQP